MPVKVPDNLPAKNILRDERIFIMDEGRAFEQDIRPLKIVILNLMPDKEATEVDLLRVLSNSPLQIEVTLAHMATHKSKNTSKEHMESFYKTINEIEKNKYDGMIITGAPVEHLKFEEVGYWEELKKIIDWSKNNVTNVLYICWAAQAALYYNFGIRKKVLDKKMFGIFKHYEVSKNKNLLRGFDDYFYVPQSRHTDIDEKDILSNENIELISKSDKSGVCIVMNKNKREIYVTGHFEYNKNTLKNEYLRDVRKDKSVEIPVNYFKNDNPNEEPIVKWRSHGNLFFSNWLNYYVYQETPYDISNIN